jgi:hypothetical protein
LVQNLLSSCFLPKSAKIKIFRIVTLLVVLDACVTLSLTVGEEHRLKVFDNKVLRKILGPKREDVTGDWRKLCNRNLFDVVLTVHRR